MNTRGTRTAPTWTAAADPSPPDRNSLAVAAMVLGLVALATSVAFVGGPLGVVGLVLAVLGLRTARRTGVGRGQAVTGAVSSALAIAVSVLVVVSAVWFAHKTQNCYHLHRIGQWEQCAQRQLDRA